MSKRRRSVFTSFGWGLVGDVLLLITALFIMGAFAVTSFTNAYAIALLFLVLVLIASTIYRRSRKKADR